MLIANLSARSLADLEDALEAARDRFEEDMSLLDGQAYETAATNAFKYGLTFDKVRSDMPLTFADILRCRDALEAAQGLATEVEQWQAADGYACALAEVEGLLSRS